MLMGQIDRHLANVQKQYENRPPAVLAVPEAGADAKVIGVRVPAAVRERLEAIRKKHGFKSIKEAALATLAYGAEALTK